MNQQKNLILGQTQSIQTMINPSDPWLNRIQKNSYKKESNSVENNKNQTENYIHKNENLSTCSIEDESEENQVKYSKFIKNIHSSIKLNENSHRSVSKSKSFVSIGNLEENNLQANSLTDINFLNRSQSNWSNPFNNPNGFMNSYSNFLKSRYTLDKSRSNLFDMKNYHIENSSFHQNGFNKIMEDNTSSKKFGSSFRTPQINKIYLQSTDSINHTNYFPFKKNPFVDNSSPNIKFNKVFPNINESLNSFITDYSKMNKTKKIFKNKFNHKRNLKNLVKERIKEKKRSDRSLQLSIAMNYNCCVIDGFYMNVECQPIYFENLQNDGQGKDVGFNRESDSNFSCDDQESFEYDERLKIISKNSILNDKWSNYEFKYRNLHQEQVENSVETITRHLFTDMQNIKFNKNNILTCINLQLNLPSYQLKGFNFNSKLRLFIYIYSKFFNRIRICEKVDELFPFIDLSDFTLTSNYILAE